MSNSWQAYSSIYSVGHRAVRDLLNYPHIVEEKVDGSQFSFGVFEIDEPVIADGTDMDFFGAAATKALELRVRSKGCIMITDAPEKMFTKAVETVKSIQHLLHPGWTYRGEYLAKPKHNTLAYDRVPKGNIILFDVGIGDNEWLGPKEKATEAARIGLECVPVLNFATGIGYYNVNLEGMRKLLDTKQSVLGGQLIEGVVIKPLVPLFDEHTKKTLMAKFVSERFKEAHKEAWKVTSPNSGDVLEQLTKRYKVAGRWLKAVQHLRDDGKLQDAPQDIPLLLAEIQRDLGQEEKEEIQKLLWHWAWPHVARNVTRGVAEWYKEDVLLKKQFESTDAA